MATGSNNELEPYDGSPRKGTSTGRIERGVYDENPSGRSELRLVIFGKTGTGKSSTGNSILGRTGFENRGISGSETKKCRTGQVNLNGRNVTIVDTPGVNDPFRDPMAVLHEISKCLLFVKPGPHALLFVVNANTRFTEEEENAYFAMRKLFASHLNSYVIVVFTHFDEFGNNKAKFEKRQKEYGKYVDASKEDNRTLPDIRKILADVDNRKVLFSNTEDEALNDQQVLQLLDVIQDVADSNHEPYFEDKDTATAARNLEKIIQDITKEDFRQTSAEVWEKVKRSKEVGQMQLLRALEQRDEKRCAIL